MKDTVLLENGKSRLLRSVSNFLQLYPTYESMVAALVAGTLPVDFAGVNSAGCAQIGTSLNKANLLTDATAQALGLVSQDPTINEALAALSGKADPALLFVNKTVATTAWASSVDYADYPWAASVSCSGVTVDYVADVIFSPADADSGNFAPVAVTGSGIVKIYAAEKPTAALTIPTIKCEKAVQ